MTTTARPAKGVPAEPSHEDLRRLREIYPRLRRYAAVWTTVDDDPDDLLQEAIACTLATQPLAAIEHLEAYLKTTIANLARNSFRRRARSRPAARADVATTDSYPSELSIIAALRPSDRAILYLTDVEGLPLREAASLLGCSVVAAKSRRTRARARLRAAVKKGD